MKIGFSLGRCVRDIVEGKVDIEDVAFLITATSIQDNDHLENVMSQYMYEPTYLAGLDFEKCKSVAQELWDNNKIIQPRRQGMHRHKQPEDSIWVDIFPTVLSQNESVKTAWEKYRFMIHMVENVDSEAMEVFK